MNSVGAGCAGDVRAVVDEQARLASARDFDRPRHQLKENAGGKIFFAELNERDALRDGGGYECEDALEIFTGRSAARRRRAARDEVARRLPV